MKIYFLPYAGGSEMSYNKLTAEFPENNVTSIQCSLPGRGRRVGEAFLDDVSAMAEDILSQIKTSLQGDVYMIFGHSMGALLAVHVLSLLKSSKLPLPLHLFLSGRTGVIKKPAPPLKCEMNSNQLKNALNNLGGVSEEVLRDEDVMSFFEPIIRNDFKAIEYYLPITFHDSNLKTTVYFGDKDEFSFEEAAMWQRIADKKIDVKCFSGGHFFIFDHAEEIVKDMISKFE